MKRFWIIGGTVVALALGGCSTSRTLVSSGHTGEAWTLSASPKVPAAEGKVRVAAGSDGNQTVDVSVEHLAPPSKAFSGMSYYVVWLMPEGGGPPQNLGVLSVGEDLKGHMTAKTSYKSFDVLVTAETEPGAALPSGNRAMSASVHVPT